VDQPAVGQGGARLGGLLDVEDGGHEVDEAGRVVHDHERVEHGAGFLLMKDHTRKPGSECGQFLTAAAAPRS
jgi:hypothetical protein